MVYTKYLDSLNISSVETYYDAFYILAIDCGPPPVVLNSVIISNFNTTFHSRVDYRCISGYEFKGGERSRHVTCESDLQWHPSLDKSCKGNLKENVSVLPNPFFLI